MLNEESVVGQSKSRLWNRNKQKGPTKTITLTGETKIDPRSIQAGLLTKVNGKKWIKMFGLFDCIWVHFMQINAVQDQIHVILF